MSGKLIERLQHQQQRMALATQQNNRQRSNQPLQIQVEEGATTGMNGTQPPKSAAFFLRRNTSEFRVEQQELGMKKGGVIGLEGKDIATLPKNTFKQVQFLASPRGSAGNDSMYKRRQSSNQGGVVSSLENASTALGLNMVKSPIFDRRHLRTRGTGNGTESFDFFNSQPSSRGVFSSFSKGSFPLQNALSQGNLQDECATVGFMSPQPSSSLQPRPGYNFTRPPPDDPSQIWNRHTFSYTVSRMRPKIRLSSKSGLQSDYLDRMQKNKIEKLSRFVDEEKNRVKAKREQLETLKTELEMIRLITGKNSEQQLVMEQNDPKSPRSPREDVQESLRLAMLRPDLSNKGCQLTSFAASMNIHDNLTHTVPSNAIQDLKNTTANLRTPALISNAPNLSKSIYQPYYPMTFDDEAISANLLKMKEDLETKLKEVEFKHKSEFFVYQQLDNQRIRERKEITSLTFRHRDVVPEQNRYEKAIEQVPLIKMLSDTAKEQQKNLLTERKKQLDRKKEFLQEILSKKVAQLKVHSKEMDALQAAIGKRQRRIDEMKEHLYELKENNRDEEVKKQEMIASLINKNLEFKVLSGIEVIVKLEEALKAVDSQKLDQTNIDDMKKVRSSAMSVDMLSKQDLEGMNVKKIEKLKYYEQHFTQIFPNVEKISINDAFLQKRYEDICFSIHSKTEKYQELVQTCHIKRKLIKQFLKFKNQVEQDRQFLASHLKHEQSLSDTMKSTTTLNDMRCAEYQLKRGLIDQDHQMKKQIIAQACTFVTVLLGRYSYILRELFQMIRFEHTLPGTERDGPQQIPLTEYFQGDFLTLIQKCSSKFALENIPQQFIETAQSSFDRKGATNNPINGGNRSSVVSPAKKKRENNLSPGQVSSMNTTGGGFLRLPHKTKKNMYLSQPNMQLVSAASQSLKTLKNSHTIRGRPYMDAGHEHSQPSFNFHLEVEEDGTLENFDMTTMEDLKAFLNHLINQREPYRLLEVAGVTQHDREFQHKYAISYIKQHAVLNRLCEYCQITREMGIENVTILMNGLDFKAKNPKLRTKEIANDNDDIKVSRRIAGNKELHEDYIQEHDESDSSEQVPEEDYVDPDTKHIISDVLMADKKRLDMEIRRKKREKEREKLLKKMSDAERREQNKIKLQRQIAALQLYQKDEHSFRAQFKNNLADVFNNDLPKEKETRQYLILDGQALSAMANTTLKNQKDPYKHYPHKLPENVVGITSQPDLQRAHHKNEHHRIVMQSQTLRTQSLKGQLKRLKTQQSTLNDDPNSPTGEDESMMSMAAINAEPPKGMSAAAAFKKLQSQRLLERQQQRRSVVKINKPQERQGNIVLQMLQDKFPELEKLFMDTTTRRNQRRNEMNHLKSAGTSLISSPTSPNTVDQQIQGYSPMAGRKGNSSINLTNGLGSAGMDDDTTQLANTAGGYNSDDQMAANAAGVLGPVSGFAYHTQEDEDEVSFAEPIIKVKPVYPRGVFK